LPPGAILTPHPGEFDRLTGHSASGFERNEKQIEFSKKHAVTVVLKGAYTSTTLSNGKCLYNSTGNPGMATAGAGDVLTGIILSLLAQGYSADDAAITGTYLHGLAGDIAAEKFGQHALIASDIIENTGNAIKQIIEK
jgi:NAD(P)H-hydrate epimerase